MANSLSNVKVEVTSTTVIAETGAIEVVLASPTGPSGPQGPKGDPGYGVTVSQNSPVDGEGNPGDIWFVIDAAP